MDDKALVKASLEGDQKAFEKLVKQYYQIIVKLAYRFVGDYDDSKDVAQTAFIKAYQRLASFDTNQRFLNWIYRIAINEAIDLLEARKRQSSLQEEPAKDQRSPEEVYLQTKQHERLQKAIMDMNVPSRTLLILRHFADLSYDELSYVFDTPEKTIKSRLFDARRRLSRFLETRSTATR